MEHDTSKAENCALCMPRDENGASENRCEWSSTQMSSNVFKNSVFEVNRRTNNKKTLDRVHELGCYLEAELSSYVGVLRARSTLRKERIRVRRMHGSASVG